MTPVEFRQSLLTTYPTSRALLYASARKLRTREFRCTFTHPLLSPDFCDVRITALVYGAADICHTPERRESVTIPRRSLSRCATHVQAPPLVAHLAAHSRPDNQLCVKGTSSYAIQGVPSVTTDLKILTTILYALQNCARVKTSRH